MQKLKSKLFLSIISLGLAVVMLAVSSMAWFTLSTNPEISGISVTLYTKRTLLLSTDGEEFSETIDLSEKFAGLAPLHPVSTVNGIDWFIPTYETSGALKDPSQFIHDLVGEADPAGQHDNVLVTGLSGLALMEAQNQGYYVHTDFWVKSEEENGCKVRISIPHAITESELDGNYGTYVLPDIKLGGSEGQATLVDAGRNTMTAVRIGFLVHDKNGNPTRFVIFEPNAELRSEISDKPENGNMYIVGYSLTAEQYANGNYIKTQPIGFRDAQGSDYTQLSLAIPTLYSENDGYYTEVTNGNYSLGNGKKYYTFKEYEEFEYTPGMETGENFPKEVYTYNSSTHSYNLVNEFPDKPQAMWKKVFEEFDFDDEFEKAYKTLFGDNASFDGKLYTRSGSEGAYTYTEVEADSSGYRNYNFTSTSTETATPYYVPNPSNQKVAAALDLDPDHLIAQLSGSWKDSAKSALASDNDVLNSTDVDFGKFLNTNTLYGNDTGTVIDMMETQPLSAADNGIAGDALIVNLTDTDPIKITMFVWIEGQDVDCWNDITSGKFRVNIELAGETNP